MPLATFFEHFELLADQPDATAKMREFVLQLAVKGKLLPQNPKDEPADKLLELIKTEKLRLVAEGVIKESGDDSPVEIEIPVNELPVGWVQTQVGQIILRISNGCSALQTKNPSKFPVTRIETISDGTVNLSRVGYVEGLDQKTVEQYRLTSGDILFSHINSPEHLGKTAIYQEASLLLHGTNLLLIRLPTSFVVPSFFHLTMKAMRQAGYFVSIAQHAIHQASVNQTKVKNANFNLPPLAEQRRIVAKVDELMVLCDELEQRQQSRQHARDQLQHSALHHLLAAREPVIFAAARQRVRDHFHLLHDTPDAIPQLRQAILQLAVQGRLIPQNPKDEPADKLLERIKAEKLRRLRERDLREEEAALEITGEECQHPLPATWQWVRLGEIQIFTNGFAFQSKDYETSGVGLVRIGDIQNGEVAMSDMKFINPSFLKSIDSKFQVRPGDLLIAMSGATTGKLGFNRTDQTFFLNQRVGRMELVIVEPQFAANYLATQIQENLRISSGSAIPNLSTEQINQTVFPLPPLAEQKRIVARVEELMRWCDTLEAQLHQTRTLGAHLLASTLHHLLAA